MNTKYIVLIIFLCLTVYACSNDNDELDYCQMAHRITNQTARKLEKEKKLHLIGTGGGMMYNVRMMAMKFYFYKELDLVTVRELMVYTINTYLNAINEDEEIRPYLCEFPFTVKNIEITIFPRKADNSDPSPGNLYYVTSDDGILGYYIEIEESRQLIHEETFAEAQRIVLLESENSKNKSTRK